MKKLEGVIPPMVTPFTSGGNVDEYNLTKLVHFLNEHVHGLFICGSYGNGPLMSVEEKQRVIDVVAKQIAPTIQLVVHVGSTNVRDAVTLARHAEGAGAATVSSVVPYYFHHTRESIKRSPQYTEESLLNRDYEARLHGHYNRQGYWANEQADKEHSH